MLSQPIHHTPEHIFLKDHFIWMEDNEKYFILMNIMKIAPNSHISGEW